MEDKDINPIIVHIQRKRRQAGNFSLEFIFKDVRERLQSKYRFRLLIASRTSSGVWNRFVNIVQVFLYQGKINHVTGDIHYVTYLLKHRGTILTILDCGFMDQARGLKQDLLKFFWLTLPVAKAKYITAISEATKRDILKYTGCDAGKVSVIPVAVDEMYQPVPKQFNEACPRLLQIGTAANKNVERLIQAIRGIECTLVIIGRLSESQVKCLSDNGVTYINRMNLSQQEIYEEYINADIVTFVSTFEGFGMPIIEANCVERPVIAGNNSSMPEVGGDAALYVDACSVEDIRSGLERMIHDQSLREHLIQEGRVNRTRYSNKTIAEMYGALYEKVISHLQS